MTQAEQPLTQEEEDALRAARKDILLSIEAAYYGTIGGLHAELARNDLNIRHLQAQADNLAQWARNLVDSSVNTWSGRMAQLKLPVHGGSVVAWTKRLTKDELVLAIGDDEYWVVYANQAQLPHHFGPAIQPNGRRVCLSCPQQHYANLETYDLAIVPDDTPAAVQQALAALAAPLVYEPPPDTETPPAGP